MRIQARETYLIICRSVSFAILLVVFIGCSDSPDALLLKAQVELLEKQRADLLGERDRLMENLESLEEECDENYQQTVSNLNSWKARASKAESRIANLESEIALNEEETVAKRDEEKLKETAKETFTFTPESKLVWSWEGNFQNNCGQLSIGGIPPGCDLSIELIDPIVGALIINGIKENAKKITFDPQQVKWSFRSDTGGSLGLCIFGVRGGSSYNIRDDWWVIKAIPR